MDQHAFLRLTTVIATATSRRAAIRAALALLVGGSALAATTGASAATCRKGRQTCTRNAQCCSGTCQTGRGIPTRDRNRCTCEAGTRLCGTACVDTDTDKRHCGACGNACNAGDTCIDGECRIDQQCHTGDGPGICYMSLDGREHRVDGFYVVSGGLPRVPCSSDRSCESATELCSVPGVSCKCARAVDDGFGYDDLGDARTGFCAPLFDSGDQAVTCEASYPESVCVFTADRRELFICPELTGEQGPCIDGSCDGVGVCDDLDGVQAACACVVAFKGMASIPIDAYFPILNDRHVEPKCLSYQITNGFTCDLP